MSTVLRLVLSDLAHDPLRALFNALGIAAVVMSTLLMNALSSGLSDTLSAAPVSTNLLIIDASYQHPSDSSIALGLLEALKRWTPQPIQQISPSFYRQLRIGGHIIQLRAAAPADWPAVYNMRLAAGRWPAAPGEVVAGEGLAASNGWQIGDRLDIFGAPFTISGLYRAPGTAFSAVWMTLAAAQALFGPERAIQMVTLVLTPGADPAAVSADLGQSPDLAGKYSVFLRDSYTARNGQIVRDLYGVLALLSLLALLAVPLSTYSLTLLNLAERTRALGLLRAVGFSHAAAHGFLLLRAVLISAGAYALGLAGAALFIAARHAAGPIFILGGQLDFVLTGGQIALVLVVTLVFALAGAWLSSGRSLRVPIQVLLSD